MWKLICLKILIVLNSTLSKRLREHWKFCINQKGNISEKNRLPQQQLKFTYTHYFSALKVLINSFSAHSLFFVCNCFRRVIFSIIQMFISQDSGLHSEPVLPSIHKFWDTYLHLFIFDENCDEVNENFMVQFI